MSYTSRYYTRQFSHSLCLSAQTVCNHLLTMTFLAVSLAFISFIAAQVEVFAQKYAHTVWALPALGIIIWILIDAFIVMSHMFAVSHQLKVLKSIVSHFAVNVMNMLSSQQPASNMLFHYVAMLSNSPAIGRNYFAIICTRFALFNICRSMMVIRTKAYSFMWPLASFNTAVSLWSHQKGLA